MAGATSAVKTDACTAVKNDGTYISLHTADPGTTGASEASGGSYARVATTWGTVTAGAVTGSQVTINVPTGTYTYFGIWSAATAGNWVTGGTITSTTMSSAGQINVTPTITVTG